MPGSVVTEVKPFESSEIFIGEHDASQERTAQKVDRKGG